MFSLPKISFANPLSYFSSRPINLPKVRVDDIETLSDRRARTLKHLLKANHANFSVIYNNLRFHNHTPHILGSAYLLGGTSEHLNDVYDRETRHLDPWKDAPGEVTGGDWRDYLGKREYQRAFIDFFEDELVQHNYDWKALLDTYLFSGKHPLFNNMICGLGHPLIHLGYAYELNSPTLAIEALTLVCGFYNSLHKYLDDPGYSRPLPPKSPLAGASPLELLRKMHGDPRFDALKLTHPGSDNADAVLEQCEDAVLKYWNAWDPSSNPQTQFRASQEAAAALLLASSGADKEKHDFFLVHLLTSSHATRIALPFVPARFEIPLAQQWWFFTVLTYVCQLRPEIGDITAAVADMPANKRDWKYIDHQALAGKYRFDPHYVKALRAMREAAQTWGDEEGFWIKAAVGFADGFGGWGGFGMDVESEEIENAGYE